MADIHLGRHNLKSHGFTLARFHMYDWLIFVVLVLIEVALNVIEPFHRFVGAQNAELIYPLKENTVPVWAVPLFAVLLPTVIFVGIYIKRNDVFDMHNAILGLLYSVLITGVITDAIKDAVGRPRPNFYKRCFPNGTQDVIKEGYKSFPSGHTSWSFAGLGFTSWYLAGKLRAFDRQGHISKLCIIFAPLLVATLVAISRIDDYWHHWTDVFAGGLIGLIVASFCYLQFFPWPSDCDGWGPHAYFNALNQSQRNHIVYSDPSQIGTSSSRSQMSDIELGADNIHHERG